MGPQFIITKNQNTRFNLEMDTGKWGTVFIARQYQSKADCLADIESVKKNAADDSRYEKLTDQGGKYLFNFKADTRVIRSVEYREARLRDKGIESLKLFAPDATVKDSSD